MKKLLWAVLLLVLALVGVALWMRLPFPYQAGPTSDALQSSGQVRVQQSPWLVFEPAKPVQQGVIFYPGGKTAPVTFAPVMHRMAEHGVLAVIVPMPLNTAFLGINKASAVMDAYPEIQHWHLIGHSLGGVAAAAYASKHSERLSSLIFWASYPAAEIRELSLPSLSLSAALDSQSTPQKIQQYRDRFPAGTLFVELPAANHWQYGYFADSLNAEAGLQSRAMQINAVLAQTLMFMQSLSADGTGPTEELEQ